MIHLFKSTTTKSDLIKYNGDYILDTITSSAIINEELNGVYTLDLRLSIVDSFEQKGYDMVTESSLIKINDEYGDEYFRIAQVRKNKRYIEVFARHITISDTLTMWLEDVRPENRNGNSAINYIFANATTPSWFNVSSDISNQATAYYVNKTVYEALGTVDNSFLNRWGGEFYRRGFNIQINARVGGDKGVSIRSRKNLTGLEVSTNENELTTRIYPKGWDGISLDEKKVDSPLINSYSRIFSREKKFEDIRVNDEEYKEGFETLHAAQEEMRVRCKRMFEVDRVDIITASYRIDFVELAKTEEYKNYSVVEKTWLGDTVHVFDEDLNIDIDVRVVSRTFDCLKKERTSTNLSNKNTKIKPPTIADILSDLEKLPSTDSILQQAKNNATALINAGLKDSYVVVRQNEMLIMDTTDINTATNVWRWNRGGLGFSNTGYYGEYGLAMTNDGAIVADRITVGELNGNIIKANSIQANRLDVDVAQKIANSQSESEVKTLVTIALGSFKVEISEELTKVLEDYSTTTKMNSAIDAKANEITLAVNKTISDVDGKVDSAQAQITLQAEELSTKVDVNGVKTTISQSEKEVVIAFNEYGKEEARIEYKKEGIKTSSSDGSYSMIGNGIITNHIAGEEYTYHSLSYIQTIVSTSEWCIIDGIYTVPERFRNKDFNVIATVSYLAFDRNVDDVNKNLNISVTDINPSSCTYRLHCVPVGVNISERFTVNASQLEVVVTVIA